MRRKEEAYTEYLGSEAGTTLLKVKKTKSGIKVKVAGTGYELLQIAAILIDSVAVDTQVPHSEALGAVMEFLEEGDK